MKEDKSVKNNQCFVIMPISDPKEYETGHFRFVYEDIFKPAILEAGFTPKRADDDKSSSMIQINIIKDIINSPMAICDLSTRNPNVLFELGIRQAFDLPVVLVQEVDTPRIFDISTINTIDYGKTLGYREVIEDREKIKNAIIETKDNSKGINSIVGLLGIEPAKGKDNIGENELLYTISNQIQNIMNRLDDNDKNKSASTQHRKINIIPEKELERQYNIIRDLYPTVETVEAAVILLKMIKILYDEYRQLNMEKDHHNELATLDNMGEGLRTKFDIK